MNYRLSPLFLSLPFKTELSFFLLNKNVLDIDLVVTAQLQPKTSLCDKAFGV
jgi:hypothetical protein